MAFRVFKFWISDAIGLIFFFHPTVVHPFLHLINILWMYLKFFSMLLILLRQRLYLKRWKENSFTVPWCVSFIRKRTSAKWKLSSPGQLPRAVKSEIKPVVWSGSWWNARRITSGALSRMRRRSRAIGIIWESSIRYCNPVAFAFYLSIKNIEFYISDQRVISAQSQRRVKYIKKKEETKKFSYIVWFISALARQCLILAKYVGHIRSEQLYVTFLSFLLWVNVEIRFVRESQYGIVPAALER